MVIITSINDSELHKFVLFYSLFLEDKKIILIDTFIQLLLPEKEEKEGHRKSSCTESFIWQYM